MMEDTFLKELHAFIVRAKSFTYVGDDQPVSSCRISSHDLKYTEGDWSYLDSYFGGRDFIGEEVVYYREKPVWGMNYYGRILRADLISPAQAGQVIQASLSKMYAEGRFLGGFQHEHEGFAYTDTSEGEMSCFRGREWIARAGKTVYELLYHGGLIKDD
jgi:hypothetical protein